MNNWWKNAVVYQIYPRSFQDSDGDGIGDIRGIINRLDYLEHLGVDALWLSPVYLSPQVDNGYDVQDYRQIDPIFGTMADMKELIETARKKGIRIIMDLVLNHTSSKNEWFINAKENKKSPYRDFFVWHDPVDGHEPNDLTSGFASGSAWTLEPHTGQYFLHLFAKEQPDLNWSNPKLRQALYEIIKFWMALGVGGFRLDVIDLIGKEPLQKILANGPKLHDYLQEMNAATYGTGDYLTVGETWNAGPALAKKYSAEKNHELSMVFSFSHMWADRVVGGNKWDTKVLNVKELKKAFYDNQLVLADEGWPTLFFDNHDLPRAVSRFGDIARRELSAKMLAILLYGFRGTPYIFQGEEIGMTDSPVEDISEVNDVEARSIYSVLVKRGVAESEAIRRINIFSRDNARTPMQWNSDKNAGFSVGKPWLPVNNNYREINVQQQISDKKSVFETYRRLIELRHNSKVLSQGDFVPIEDVPDQVFAYERNYQGQSVLVLVNFLGTEVTVDLPQIKLGDTLISNYENVSPSLRKMTLRPFESFITTIHH